MEDIITIGNTRYERAEFRRLEGLDDETVQGIIGKIEGTFPVSAMDRRHVVSAVDAEADAVRAVMADTAAERKGASRIDWDTVLEKAVVYGLMLAMFWMLTKALC